MMKKIEYLIKHNTFIQRMYVIILGLVFRFLGLFIKKDEKRIIFQSMIGKTYGDSPKVLFDEIKKDGFFSDYHFVWAFDNPDKFKIDGAEKVKLNSLKYFIETIKSRVWITNVDMERGLHYKPNGTVYVNTWHGVPIKTIGNAQKNRNDYNYFDVDFLCCSSPFEKEIFIRDFNVKPGAIVQCGMPRNDELYHITEEDKARYREELNIPENKKVILYCPTWRDSVDGGNSYQIAPPINIDYWRSELSKEYVVLFRMHHLTTAMLGIQFDDFAIDVTAIPQINKLLAIADILISDYSATIFDYCILGRPIISFAYDYDEYSKSRGFYEDLETVLPGSVCRTQEEVIQHINHIDYEEECRKTQKVKSKYIQTEGNATERCMAYIKSRVMEK